MAFKFNPLTGEFELVTIPLDSFRNKIINGDLNLWERGTSFTSVINGAYTADRFIWEKSGAGVVTITQDADTKDGLSESSLKIDITTADATLAASDFYMKGQRIEGFNTIPFGMGSSDAVQIILGFNVKSPKTGIHCVAFRNNVSNRSYIAEYTVNVADTWESKIVTITGDLTGTWLKTNGVGLRVSFALAVGSTFQTVADVWTAGNFLATSNQVNVMDNVANNFLIDQIQLEVGNVATDFEQRLHSLELELCKWYYERLGGTVSFAYGIGQCINTTSALTYLDYNEKRVTPTISIGSVAADFSITIAAGTGQAVTALSAETISPKSCRMAVTVAANLVAGDVTRLIDDTLNNSFIEVDAEL